ncbi:MAG: J domain-containing protein [Rickettsiales bacterium]
MNPRDGISASYWHVRITAALDMLEREARRMFQLEGELSQFAGEYYNAVGQATERLARLEQYSTEPVPEEMNAMPAVLAQRDAGDERRVELKSRYRSLAKEVHPDRAMVVEGTGKAASHMHMLNAAYQQGDLAVLLRIEAQMVIERIQLDENAKISEIENALREIERAANTYAEGYRSMLNSPLNELMLRAMSARLAGWDWMEAVLRKVERNIEEKQRAIALHYIAQIGEWRDETTAA